MHEYLFNPDLWRPLPDRLGWHAVLVLLSVMTGVLISVPLGIFAAGRGWLRGAVLGVAGVLQTIPGLAMLALVFVGLIALSGWMQAAWGLDDPLFSSIGFWPSLIALTLYSLLPILRNTVTGIEGVDASLVEAARGCGMNRWQRLTRVELPLASPVILAGVRTATVWTVGIATLAALISQPCLGGYIVTGLFTANTPAVVFGCVWAAALALVLDGLLGQVERGLVRRQPRRLWVAAAGLAVVMAAATGPVLYQQATAGLNTKPAVVIGAKPFPESAILAHLIAETLDDDFRPIVRDNLGGPVAFEALTANQIDMYVDYSGTVWATLMRRPVESDRDTVMREMTRWLRDEHGVVAVGSLGFENAYAFAIRRETAEKLKVTTIADLAPHSPSMKIAGDLEIFDREEWTRARDAYGLGFQSTNPMSSTNMYPAIAAGEVDVILAYTADPQVDQYNLVILADPKRVLPPYDAVLLLSPDAAARPGLIDKLKPLMGALDVETMRRANYEAGVEGRAVEAVAASLQHRILRRDAGH